MTDGWRLQDHPDAVSGEQAAELIRVRKAHGLFETWFEHDSGRLLAVVTNGSRAVVTVLDEPGDAGEHAIDPCATGRQGGYVLGNGQHDAYDNADTVALEQALTIVEHILDCGRPPAGASWRVDR
jgi:hypothetical protein